MGWAGGPLGVVRQRDTPNRWPLSAPGWRAVPGEAAGQLWWANHVPQIRMHPGPVTVTLFGIKFLGRHLFPPIPADRGEAQTFKYLDISRKTVE